MSRPLRFSSQVETILAEKAENPEHLAQLRARYRFFVSALHETPHQAVKSAQTLTAAAISVPEVPETVELIQETEYSTPEHAIFALAEYSGLGHEMIPALRAAWRRGTHDSPAKPFDRAVTLATSLYTSQDADLLPRRESPE